MRRTWKSVIAVAASLAALALLAPGCNATDADPCGDGARVELGDSTACVYPRYITETGFLCPEQYPDGWEFGDAVVCVPEGVELGADDSERLCASLSRDGYAWDAASTTCTSPSGAAATPRRRSSGGGDAGGDATDAGRDGGIPDALDVEAEVIESDSAIPDAIEGDIPIVTDVSVGDAPDALDASPQISCDNFTAETACPVGTLCVQTAPPYCSVDWIGVCTPPNEGTCPAVEVCGCSGERFGDACQARDAGYRLVFVECDAASQCPGEAASCEEGCYSMFARPIFVDRGCVGRGMPLRVGCTIDDGGTDDEICVRSVATGEAYVGTSGSVFRNSTAWVECEEEDAAREIAFSGVICDD